jgi:hypothetical protein
VSFHTCPDWLWGSLSFLYNEYRVSFLGVKQSGHGADHPPPSSAEVRERVELYLHSPSGLLWPVLLCTLPLPYLCCVADNDKAITFEKWMCLYMQFQTGNLWNNVLILIY